MNATSFTIPSRVEEARMGMYSLIEDARMKAFDAANCWHESDEAKRLLCELDAAERSSDRYSGFGWTGVSQAFGERVSEIIDELDDLRREAIDAAADTYGTRISDEWLDAWDAADEDAPPVEQVARDARRRGAGDGLLEQSA